MTDKLLDVALTGMLSDLQASDAHVRTLAWQGAGKHGAAAVKPLAAIAADAETEARRAAKLALWRVARNVVRPGADDNQRRAVMRELTALLKKNVSVPVRVEVLRMLSETGGSESVSAIAELLSHHELRDEARMALEGIPDPASVTALRDALASAGEDFKPNLAQSLRARGVEVPGHSCQKLVPNRQTMVKPFTADEA
jgi:HEAT repeat protein